MAVYTTINDPSVYFQTQIYTGTGSTNSVTNSGNSNLQPDWIWLKDRSATNGNAVQDTSRGITKVLFINGTDSEDQYTNTVVNSVQSDGFTVSTNANSNTNGNNYVAWQWKANAGNKTSFSASGSQLAGTHQANTTAGFSLVTYTGNGSSNSTIPHGLGVMPEYVMVKNRGDVDEWVSNGSVLGDYCRLHPNADSSKACGQGSHDYIKYPGTDATNLLTGVSHNRSNANGDNYIAWCFASKQGYSKLGTYNGNGNDNGPFIYTGFKPAFLMIKRTDASNDWWIIDDKRDDYQNPFSDLIVANTNAVENANTARGDLLSNGFKWRVSANAFNATGGSYFYMAFASNPFVTSDGVPTTAK